MLKLYENIKRHRKAKKMTQDELARLTGYTDRSSIARIEKGEIDLPQSKIKQFAQALGTTPSQLMGWEEVQKKNDTISDIVIRMQTDEMFLSAVESLYRLDQKKLASILTLLD